MRPQDVLAVAAGRSRRAVAVLAIAGALAACAGPGGSPGGTGPRADAPPEASGARRGAFYKDDGPGDSPPADLAAIPDAQPRAEPLHPRANRPYVVFGRQYVPMVRPASFRERGIASWYGRRFHGNPTSSGEPYDMYAMTAAHPTLPIPSYVRVTHLRNGRSVVVRVNDRGPFLHGRVIDLSWTAAAKLGYVAQGSAEVEVELLQPETPEPGIVLVSSDAARAPGAPAAGPVAAVLPAALPPAGAPAVTPSAASSGPSVQTAQLAQPPQANPATGSPPARDPPLRLEVETTVQRDPRAPVPAAAAAPPTPGAAVTAAPVDAAAAAAPWLQLGAFTARENAEAVLARVRAALGERVGARLEIRRDGAMHRVVAGPYPDRAQALAAAERIRTSTDLRPFPTSGPTTQTGASASPASPAGGAASSEAARR